MIADRKELLTAEDAKGSGESPARGANRSKEVAARGVSANFIWHFPIQAMSAITAILQLAIDIRGGSAGVTRLGPRFFTSITLIRSSNSIGAYMPLGRKRSARVSFS